MARKNTIYYRVTDKQTVPASATGTGTVDTQGVMVTGTGTLFQTEMPAGSWLVDFATDQIAKVKKVYSNTSAELLTGFTVDLSGAAAEIIHNNEASVCTISVAIKSGDGDGEIDGVVFDNGDTLTFSKDSRDNSSARDLVDPIIIDGTSTSIKVLIQK